MALRFRLPAALRRGRMSQSTVMRERLESALLERPHARGELSCADLAGELVGSFRGPRDLSSYRCHLERAVLPDARRGRKARR